MTEFVERFYVVLYHLIYICVNKWTAGYTQVLIEANLLPIMDGAAALSANVVSVSYRMLQVALSDRRSGVCQMKSQLADSAFLARVI